MLKKILVFYCLKNACAYRFSSSNSIRRSCCLKSNSRSIPILLLRCIIQKGRDFIHLQPPKRVMLVKKDYPLLLIDDYYHPEVNHGGNLYSCEIFGR